MIISFNFEERAAAAQSGNFSPRSQSTQPTQGGSSSQPNRPRPDSERRDAALQEVYGEGTVTYFRYYYENAAGQTVAHRTHQNPAARRIREDLMRMGLVVGTPLATSLISGIILSNTFLDRTGPAPSEPPQTTADKGSAAQKAARQAAQAGAALSQATPTSPERLNLAQGRAGAAGGGSGQIPANRVAVRQPARTAGVAAAPVELPTLTRLPSVQNPPVQNLPAAASEAAPATPDQTAPAVSAPAQIAPAQIAPDQTAPGAPLDRSLTPTIAESSPDQAAAIANVAPPEQLPVSTGRSPEVALATFSSLTLPIEPQISTPGLESTPSAFPPAAALSKLGKAGTLKLEAVPGANFIK